MQTIAHREISWEGLLVERADVYLGGVCTLFIAPAVDLDSASIAGLVIGQSIVDSLADRVAIGAITGLALL